MDPLAAGQTQVYVGNIPNGVDEPTLHALFMHCGQVTQIRIAGDPTFETRFAFIEFADGQQAKTATLLDGMQLFDRPLRVSLARSPTGGGAAAGAGGAAPAAAAAGGSIVAPAKNDPDRVYRTIHVGGIPMDEVTEPMLAEYFKNVGEVTAVRISGRFAWIEFSEQTAAQQALTLDGESLGNSTLRVSQSKTPIHTAGWRPNKPGGDQAAPAGGAPAAVVPQVPPPVAYGAPPPAYGAHPGYGAPPPAYGGYPGYGAPPPPAYGGYPGYGAPPPAGYGAPPPAGYGAPPPGPPGGGPPAGYGGPPPGPPGPPGGY